jgi:hypothetical protein
MFTVKHITISYPGPEIANFYSGDRITHCPSTDTLGALEVRLGDTLVAALWGGVAEVYNSNGKMIAQYHLPPDPRRDCPDTGRHVMSAAAEADYMLNAAEHKKALGALGAVQGQINRQGSETQKRYERSLGLRAL